MPQHRDQQPKTRNKKTRTIQTRQEKTTAMGTWNWNNHLNQTMQNSNRMSGTITPTRLYFQLVRQGPSRNFALEPGEHQLISARERPVTSRIHTKTAKPYEKRTADELVCGIHMIEQLNAHMEIDDNDNDNEARIASLYRTVKIYDKCLMSG